MVVRQRGAISAPTPRRAPVRGPFSRLLSLLLLSLATGLLLLGNAPAAGVTTSMELQRALPDTRRLPVPPHRATYDVFRQGTRLGTVEVRLTLDAGGVYEYTAETRATHFVARMMGVGASETGRFIWHDGLIRPIFYEQQINRPGPDRHWHANFDWAALVATGRSHRGPFSTELRDDAVDPLTQRLQLAVSLMDSESDRYEFWVIDRDELEQQVFVRGETSRFELDGSCVRAVHFTLEESDPARADHTWLTPDMYWLPVRWRQVRDGREVVDVRLSRTTLKADTPRDCRSTRH
jgi:hypothetical protein